MRQNDISVDIPVGMSGALADFSAIFSQEFLTRKGLEIHRRASLKLIDLEGLTVVADEHTVFTYLGNHKWKVGPKDAIKDHKHKI